MGLVHEMDRGFDCASLDRVHATPESQALPTLKFAPVIVDGHKAVAGLVHVPFTFRVDR